MEECSRRLGRSRRSHVHRILFLFLAERKPLSQWTSVDICHGCRNCGNTVWKVQLRSNLRRPSARQLVVLGLNYEADNASTYKFKPAISAYQCTSLQNFNKSGKCIIPKFVLAVRYVAAIRNYSALKAKLKPKFASMTPVIFRGKMSELPELKHSAVIGVSGAML